MQDLKKRSRRRLSSLRRIINAQLSDSLSFYPEAEKTFFMSAEFLLKDVESFFKLLGL